MREGDTVARLGGDLNMGQQKAGWYNGYVSGVRPDEAVRDLFGFAGFGMARLLPHESGQGYRKVLREEAVDDGVLAFRKADAHAPQQTAIAAE